MKKTLLVLFATIQLGGANLWGEDIRITPVTIDKTDLKVTNFGIFAGGKAVVISKGTDTAKIKMTIDNKIVKINGKEEFDASKYTIFGDSKDAKVTSISITINEGAIVGSVVGGGYRTSSSSSADVSGDISITIAAATAKHYLVGVASCRTCKSV